MVAWKIAPSFAYKTAFVAGLVLIAHSLTNYSVGVSLTGVSERGEYCDVVKRV